MSVRRPMTPQHRRKLAEARQKYLASERPVQRYAGPPTPVRDEREIALAMAELLVAASVEALKLAALGHMGIARAQAMWRRAVGNELIDSHSPEWLHPCAVVPHDD